MILFRGFLIAGALFAAAVSGSAQEKPPGDLSNLLREKLKGSGLPSLAAAIIVDGELRAAGGAGVRKMGDDSAVTVEDKFHIGSCTKSMTATLAAALVEDGMIRWDSTIGEVLGEPAKKSGFRDVTLRQLLSHTAGFPKEVPRPIWSRAWQARGTPRKQRESFAEEMLGEPLQDPPGKGFEYSNSGYSIAGLMLETVAKKPWEELMRARIFERLGMKSAGFREPASDGKIDQPWGHHVSGEPQAPGPKADNPNAIAPGGIVHCSITDLARYAKMHALRETGPVLKEAESFDALHTIVAEDGDYALGWVVVERGWAGGKALTHGGSNTMFATVMWLAPKRDFAVVVATNIGMKAAHPTLDGVAGALIAEYLD